MICEQLAITGSSHIRLLIIVAIACLVAGVILALGVRRCRFRVAAAIIFISLIGVTAEIVPAPSAHAAASSCSTTGAPLSVSQTFALSGLAPGVSPAPITGEVTNTGAESFHVTAIDVEITSITPHGDSIAGRCDVTDYVLLNPRMRVDRTLKMGQSTTFTGALIGFSNKPISQDACQNAIVNLHYIAH